MSTKYLVRLNNLYRHPNGNLEYKGVIESYFSEYWAGAVQIFNNLRMKCGSGQVLWDRGEDELNDSGHIDLMRVMEIQGENGQEFGIDIRIVRAKEPETPPKWM